jgi:uncharacterized membrane protein YraQ (UPF0718 family)
MWKHQWRWLLALTGLFALCFWLPVGTPRFDSAFLASLKQVKSYAREHVLLCLVPALFIAGAVGVFVNQAAVMRYLGPAAKKSIAYVVASTSGAILAVCSCTILPLFAGIYQRGAGLGPAAAFLYSGPSINIMAIILTARVLGLEIGVARALGALIMSVFIGLCMHGLFRRDELAKAAASINSQDDKQALDDGRPWWQNALYFGSMLAILVFANWGKPVDEDGIWFIVWNSKWYLTSIAGILLAVSLLLYFAMPWWQIAGIAGPVILLAYFFPRYPTLAFTAAFLGLGHFTSSAKNRELNSWFSATWDFAKAIMPLLLAGVLIAGLLLGTAGQEGLIPDDYVLRAVGGNSFLANFCASFLGALMYFATLTEVPILEGLLGAGMGKGPALALLLAGPALSLPSILVINQVLGVRKTIAFVALVVSFSTVAGCVFGMISG